MAEKFCSRVEGGWRRHGARWRPSRRGAPLMSARGRWPPRASEPELRAAAPETKKKAARGRATSKHTKQEDKKKEEQHGL